MKLFKRKMFTVEKTSIVDAANQCSRNWLSQFEIWGSGKPREESLRTRSLPFPPSSSLQQPSPLCVMASESPQVERTPPQSGPGDQTGTPAAETAKRKAEQTNGTQTRTKRNRYISIAWYDYGLIGSDALRLGFLTFPVSLASTLRAVSSLRFVPFRGA